MCEITILLCFKYYFGCRFLLNKSEFMLSWVMFHFFCFFLLKMTSKHWSKWSSKKRRTNLWVCSKSKLIYLKMAKTTKSTNFFCFTSQRSCCFFLFCSARAAWNSYAFLLETNSNLELSRLRWSVWTKSNLTFYYFFFHFLKRVQPTFFCVPKFFYHQISTFEFFAGNHHNTFAYQV